MKKNSSRLAYQDFSSSTFMILRLEEPCEFAGTAGIQANLSPREISWLRKAGEMNRTRSQRGSFSCPGHPRQSFT